MILNAKNNNWRLEFPANFFFEDVMEKYDFLIKRLPCPYKTLKDYVNAGVQEVTFPSASLPVATQENLHNNQVPWKGKGDLDFNITKEITVTFKLYEGFSNYWIFWETLSKFGEYTTRRQAFPDLYLSFMDNTGFELYTAKFGRVIYTGISELQLSFSSNIPDFKTFTCDFTYTDFTLLRRLD